VSFWTPINDRGNGVYQERAKKVAEITEYEPVIGDIIGREDSFGFVWCGLVVDLAGEYLPARDPFTHMKYRDFRVLVLENEDYPGQVGKVIQWSTLGGWEVISRLEDDNDGQ
jgi:hypothetical protein